MDEYDYGTEQQLWQAVHALHEQAHGLTPFRTCVAEPCRWLGVYPSQSHIRDLGSVPAGPAAASLPLLGQDR